jgi:energy-coupling factor transporter ATP-binding protein EcfA2
MTIVTVEKKIEPVQTKKKEDASKRPVTGKWKGVDYVRKHSFLAAVREIITWSESSDVTKVGIIGKPDTGKSTMAEAIAHAIHKYSKIKFAVRVFEKEHLMNFRETLKALAQISIATNFVLVFDDISFLGADASKKQVDMIKQAETTIRHLPGGKDVKIILIYNYHYTKGLDKYLRQADYYFFTSVGSEETENVISIVGKKYMNLVSQFMRIVVSAKSRKYWLMVIGPKEPFVYKYRKPFIPVLFWNNESLRFIISPTRQFMDPICGICETGIKQSDIAVGLEALEKIIKRGEINYGSYFRAAVQLMLFINGMTVYGKKFVRAIKYLNLALGSNQQVTLAALAAHYNFQITKTRLDLKADDPLAAPPQ